jgi:hypothetical protein
VEMISFCARMRMARSPFMLSYIQAGRLQSFTAGWHKLLRPDPCTDHADALYVMIPSGERTGGQPRTLAYTHATTAIRHALFRRGGPNLELEKTRGENWDDTMTPPSNDAIVINHTHTHTHTHTQTQLHNIATAHHCAVYSSPDSFASLRAAISSACAARDASRPTILACRSAISAFFFPPKNSSTNL